MKTKTQVLKLNDKASRAQRLPALADLAQVVPQSVIDPEQIRVAWDQEFDRVYISFQKDGLIAKVLPLTNGQLQKITGFSRRFLALAMGRNVSL